MVNDGSLDNVAANEHEPTPAHVRDDAARLDGPPAPTTTTAPAVIAEPPTITPEDQLPQPLLDAVAHKSAPPLRAAWAYKRADLKGAMLLAVRAHGSLSCAARAVGIGRQTVYDWKEADEAFTLAIHQAQEGAIDALERSMYQRACAGDTIAAIFMMKGLRPKKWHDKARLEVSGPGGGPVPVQVEEKERADLLATAHALREAREQKDETHASE